LRGYSEGRRREKGKPVKKSRWEELKSGDNQRFNRTGTRGGRAERENISWIDPSMGGKRKNVPETSLLEPDLPGKQIGV